MLSGFILKERKSAYINKPSLVKGFQSNAKKTKSTLFYYRR